MATTHSPDTPDDDPEPSADDGADRDGSENPFTEISLSMISEFVKESKQTESGDAADEDESDDDDDTGGLSSLHSES